MEKKHEDIIQTIIEKGKKLRTEIILSKLNPISTYSQYNSFSINNMNSCIKIDDNKNIEYKEDENFSSKNENPSDYTLAKLLNVKMLSINVLEVYFLKSLNLLHDCKDGKLSMFYIEYYFPISESGEMLSIKAEYNMISSSSIEKNRVVFGNSNLFPISFNKENIIQWKKAFIVFLIFQKSPYKFTPKLIGKVNFSFKNILKLKSLPPISFHLKIHDMNNQDNYFAILKIAICLSKDDDFEQNTSVIKADKFNEDELENNISTKFLKQFEIYSYLHIKEAIINNLNYKPNSFVRFKTIWNKINNESKLCRKTDNPHYNFVQFSPIILTKNLACKFKNNYLIIEIWNKIKSKDLLIGYSKIPLHLFYESFNFKDNCFQKPVVYENMKLDIYNNHVGLSNGHISVVLAMGILSELAKLPELSRHNLNEKLPIIKPQLIETGVSTDSDIICDKDQILSDFQKFSENNIDQIDIMQVKICIECAYHLPLAIQDSNEVIPSYFVSCQLNDGDFIIKTHTVNESNNPVWNHEQIILIKKIDINHKNLVFKVWNPPIFPINKNYESSFIIGFYTLSLQSIFKESFLIHDGIYNLLDNDGLCKGQIKIGILPLYKLDYNLEIIDYSNEKNYNFEYQQALYNYENVKNLYNHFYCTPYDLRNINSQLIGYDLLRHKIENLNCVIKKLISKSLCSQYDSKHCHYDSTVSMLYINKDFDETKNINLFNEEYYIPLSQEEITYSKTLKYAKLLLSKYNYTCVYVEDSEKNKTSSQLSLEDKELDIANIPFLSDTNLENNDLIIPSIFKKDSLEQTVNLEEDIFKIDEIIENNPICNKNLDKNPFTDDYEDNINSFNITDFHISDNNLDNYVPISPIENITDNEEINCDEVKNICEQNNITNFEENFISSDTLKIFEEVNFPEPQEDDVDAYKCLDSRSGSNNSTNIEKNRNHQELESKRENSMLSLICKSSKSISHLDAQRIAKIFAMKFE